MAATKVDIAAAKQAKQKKILIVGLVLLLILLAIQLPKIMGGGKKSSAATPATAASTDAGVAPTTSATTAPATTAAAQTAPTSLTGASVTPKAGKAQLASFSLFETKDPFVQQIKTDTGTPGSGTSTASGGSAPAKSAPAKGGKDGGAQTVKAVPTYATISVNGDPQALKTKDTFPTDDPMFVLVSVGAKTAKIGIAGGKLTDGNTVALKMGKKLTLVNTATGARYTLELLYTGTTPEETASFSPTKGDAGSTAPAAAPSSTTAAQSTTATP